MEDERRGEIEMREMRVSHKNIHTCTHTYTHEQKIRAEKGLSNSATKLLFLNTYATPVQALDGCRQYGRCKWRWTTGRDVNYGIVQKAIIRSKKIYVF